MKTDLRNSSMPSRLSTLMEAIEGDSKQYLLRAYQERILAIGRSFGEEIMEGHGCNKNMDALPSGWFRSPENAPFDVQIEGYRLLVLPARSFAMDRIVLYRKESDRDVEIGSIGFGVPGNDIVDLSFPGIHAGGDMGPIYAAANDLMTAFDDAARIYAAMHAEPEPGL